MHDVFIRNIQKEDDQAMAAIIRNTLEEFGANKPGTVYFDKATDHLTEVFSITGSAYYVAEENGKIVGGAGIFPTKNLPAGTCELVKLYLSAEARGKGLGKILMNKCLTTAKDMGYSKVYLETMPELKVAIPMYEKSGFTYLNAAQGSSGHCGCSIWMIKDISGQNKLYE